MMEQGKLAEKTKAFRYFDKPPLINSGIWQAKNIGILVD
jgi:hypothetical protein